MKKLWIFVDVYLDTKMKEASLIAVDYINLIAFAIGCVMYFNPVTGLMWMILSSLQGSSNWFQFSMSAINCLCAAIVALGGAGWNSKPTFRAFFVSAIIAFITTFIHLYKIIVMHDKKIHLAAFLFSVLFTFFYKRKIIVKRFKRTCAKVEIKLRNKNQ